MIIDEMKLIGRLGDVEPLPDEAFEGARALLHAAIAVDGDPQVVELHPRAKRRRLGHAARGGIAAGAAAAAAAVALTVTSLGGSPAAPAAANHGTSPTPSTTTSGATGQSPLVVLAAYVQANPVPPVGDASLVVRVTSNPTVKSATEYDLYTDSGKYFNGPTVALLRAAVAGNEDIGQGTFAREVTAAEAAAGGNVAAAAKAMAVATFPGGVEPATDPAAIAAKLKALGAQLKARGVTQGPLVTPQAHTENMVWENSLDALSAGAGNATVRVGVLRILSTLPDISVAKTTTDGQATLTLTAGPAVMGTGYSETLTISATTGNPISFRGGAPGKTPTVTVNYRAERTTVAAIASGAFALPSAGASQ